METGSRHNARTGRLLRPGLPGSATVRLWRNWDDDYYFGTAPTVRRRSLSCAARTRPRVDSMTDNYPSFPISSDAHKNSQVTIISRAVIVKNMLELIIAALKTYLSKTNWN